jgi:hypothetical protein
MTTRKPESGGPREPYNIPIRVFGVERSAAENAEYRALLRDIRRLLDEALRRGLLPLAPRKRSKAARRSRKRR